MSSIALTLSGNSSVLQSQYFPPIDLSDGEYVCGLVDFQTFNTIPNVDETNNMFYYGNEDDDDYEDGLDSNNNLNLQQSKNEAPDSAAAAAAAAAPPKSEISDSKVVESKNIWNYVIGINKPAAKEADESLQKFIKIPTGSYDVSDLEQVIKKELASKGVNFSLKANKNTLHCEIFCSKPIDFTKPNTIGPLLGFKSKRILTPDRTHTSRFMAEILRINVLRIECNIIKGAYLNNKPTHTLHEFSPKVPTGYKIIEAPQNVIYFPVTVKNVHDLNLSIVDQANNIVNFRGETITTRLHIKKV